jgi:PAS domain S-box-containing protein
VSLLSTERQYQLLVDSVIDYAIYMLDPDGIIVSWNTGAERLKGYASKEILGRDFAVFYTLDAQSSGQPKNALQTAASAGRYSGDGWRVRKNGSRFWASVVIDPIYVSERLIGYAKVTRDISERKQSELTLQKALHRLLLATESGGFGMTACTRSMVLNGARKRAAWVCGLNICILMIAPLPNRPMRTL